MYLLRFLPILFLLPVLVLADGDRMFKVTMDQFKDGDLFEPFPEMAISVSGSVSTTVPTLPLKENVLFLRHKKSPKEYHWVQGKVNPTNFRKLHAFSLGKNHLTVFDVVQLRFYPSKNSKAFQDEADLYFDREYVYSPRVPKLFFMKNGRWQVLGEDSLPGTIRVESQVANLKMASLNPKIRNASNSIFPVAPGPYAFVFSAPDVMPFVDIGVVRSGKALTFRPNLIRLEKSNSAGTHVSVTEAQVVAAPNLESTEVLYDKFLEELKMTEGLVDTNDFAKLYPESRQPASVDLDDTDPVYSMYVKRFDLVRAEAKDLWRKSKMAGVTALDQAFAHKFDSLQALPWRVYLLQDSVWLDPVVTSTANSGTDSAATGVAPVASVEPGAETTTPPVQLYLRFRLAALRYDVIWKGLVPGIPSDSLANLLRTPGSGTRIIVSLQNNKPVWIYGKEGAITRRHYRYVKLEVELAGHVVEAQGEFILPEYILEQPEVQEWLRPKPAAQPAVSSSSMSIPSSSSEVLSSSSQAEEAKKIVNDPRRGQLAIIDSGSFRYYGSVVEMSPFAIMTTEMTQELMGKIMLHVDTADRVKDKSSFVHPQKPVHNINWNDARKACQVNGGDLPTEAQWEFAGRAGSIEGALWNLDTVPDPSVYAIYRENSYNKRKEDEAYGPQQVATKKPNAWGIYDMSGNVAEWTRDKYFMLSFWVESSNPTGALFGSSRVYKGGSWKDKEKLLNMTVRDDEDPRYWSETLGFRCVYPLDVIGK